MFIAMNRFKIVLGKEKEFEDVWKNRDTHLKDVPGFKEFNLVKGDIIGEEAQIHGLVEGDLIIKGKILLGNESYVAGNLKSGTLVIEEGAKFAGTCDMSNSNIEK